MKRVVDSLLVLCGAAALHAQTFTTLFSFYGADGESPFGGLVQATDGNFYGTTAAGGSPGVGTIFKITSNGTLTTVYSFCSQSGCPDGDWPNVGLLQATDGNFYGTTYHGGARGDFGTVFKMTPGGALTTLHTFCSRSGCTDGRYPEAVLVQGADEYLYGTTRRGGTHDCGTVFKMTTSGKLTTLYSFGSQAALLDGASPHAGLVQATNGDFYGTTTRGGAKQFGTVFKISPGGALTTLYSFCSQSGCQDGGGPVAGLVQGVNEDLYGTTVGGGASGFGTVFRITQSGSLATLYSFCSQSGCPDGGAPEAGLVRAIDGNFYGTTAGAGTNIGGTIFKITPNGTLTTLYSFCPQDVCADGASPYASLIEATNGDFYGTTPFAFPNHTCAQFCGTIFSLSVGLGPFVETQTTSGKMGAAVTILGPDLTDATSVTFNGTAAAFTVNSTGTAISTTVPTGATTGTVQVVTPSGTLSSNVTFRVLP